MSAAHTSGPWEVVEPPTGWPGDVGFSIVKRPESGPEVYIVGSCIKAGVAGPDDARLIAAAPDLLNALKDLAHREALRIARERRDGIAHSSSRCDCSECRDLNRAKAAIAKAARE